MVNPSCRILWEKQPQQNISQECTYICKHKQFLLKYLLKFNYYKPFLITHSLTQANSRERKKERLREGGRDIYIYLAMRERERERERKHKFILESS